MLAFQKPSLQCRMLVPSIVYFTSQAYSTLLPCEKRFPFRKIPFDVYPFLGLPWNLHFPSIAEFFFGKFVSCALSWLAFSLCHSKRIDETFQFLEIMFQGWGIVWRSGFLGCSLFMNIFALKVCLSRYFSFISLSPSLPHNLNLTGSWLSYYRGDYS